MIVFLSGPDDYRREEKKRWYINEFKNKYSGLSIGYFDFVDGKEDELSDFRSFMRSQSIFDKVKLAVLAGVFDEYVREKIAPELKNILSSKTTNVLISERSEPVKVLKFLSEKPAIFQRFENLIGYERELFMRTEAKKNGLVLQDDAIRFLSDIYREDTWGLITELQKISNLKSGIVNRKDLEDLDLEIAPNYWVIISGLKGSERAGRLIALEKMLATGDPPPKVFNILASQWQEKIPQMAEYDLMVKSGKLDYEEVLVDLAIS